MHFKIAAELNYVTRGPNTLILNVHALRGASQQVTEEKFLVTPPARWDEFSIKHGHNRFVRLETGKNREIRVEYSATVEVNQRPSETLADRSGSCRDMATLLMEACRVLGIPARFSSGYLDCPAARTGLASTHAWTEAYFPGSGWIGFDPTLGEQTSFRHIAIGVSNHPRGVMPISGRFFGNSLDSIGMKVSVKIEGAEPRGTTNPESVSGQDGPSPALKESTESSAD